MVEAGRATTPELLWHKRRRREMLRAHPEIAKLFGPTAVTHALTVAAVVAHAAIALLLARVSLPWAILAAYGIGVWLSGALGSAAHEYGHRLVRGPRWLAWSMARLTTTMTWLYGSTFFYHLHMGHHRSQASTRKNEFDEFIDNEGWRAFRFLSLPATGRPTWHRAAARFMRSQWQIVHSTIMSTLVKIPIILGYVVWSRLRGRPVRPAARDAAIDSMLKLAASAGLFAAGGWNAVLYVFFSDLFLRGVLANPYFAWWISQHHMGAFFSPDEFVATGSVHGRIYNFINTNASKHCEHHDFPQIPWNRLAKLAEIAPEYYRHVPPDRTWYNVIWHYYWRTDLTYAYGYHPLRMPFGP